MLHVNHCTLSCLKDLLSTLQRDMSNKSIQVIFVSFLFSFSMDLIISMMQTHQETNVPCAAIVFSSTDEMSGQMLAKRLMHASSSSN